ncbi:MAG: N-acetylneuraminate synthase [Spirochaetota bacterium]|nr:N-acetylneuraminate synthase [Spirochaetota bacterium]
MLLEDSTFIIAEAGLNHNGDLNIAKKMIDSACDVGANAIKFQSYIAENMVVKTKDEKQYNLLKKFELSFDSQKILFNYCKSKNIHFLSSPFDESTSDFLDNLGVKVFKIASSEITNYPLIEHIAKKDKPILLSTGMSTLGEVEDAVNIIQNYNDHVLILLHCVSNYPTKAEDVNLRAMETMELAFHLPVGYSDHSMGIEIPIAAVVLGASVIEKHFTLDNSMEGPDHSISLNPTEFKKMVNGIRTVEEAIGDGIKRPIDSEQPVKDAARKSLVAKMDIPAGTILKTDMLTAKRPGHGISPKYLNLIIGKKLHKTIKQNDFINWEALLP